MKCEIFEGLAALRRDSRIGPAVRGCFELLWHLTGGRADYIVVTTKRIAYDFGVERRAVEKWLEKPAEYGLVEVIQRDKHHGTIHLYVFHPRPGRREPRPDPQRRLDFPRLDLCALKVQADLARRPTARPKVQSNRMKRPFARVSQPEIAKKMGVSLGTIDHWRDSYAPAWQEEYSRAMEAAVILIRSQAGSDQVLDDPAEYIFRARACERWARKNDQPLFPVCEAPTVSSFYETYYKPVRLADSPDKTRWSYEGTIRIWSLLTGNPPLKDITVEMLARFKAYLQKMRGKCRVGYMAANTVRKHLRNPQTLLDKAGPPGPRNRDAAGVIPGPVPWVKPPRSEEKLPRIVTPELLSQVYTATVAMEEPRFPGVKAPAWWKTLLAIAFNTQLRRRTLFEMRMEEIDWSHCQLDLPPARLKSHRRQSIHLNEVAMKHLLMIRTDRELVFPWHYTMPTFHRHFHRLQDAAGIARKDHFGLHDLRRTAATILWEDSPAAAQYALGHSAMSTTQKHYVNATGIVARALDAMPQPAAFVS